MATLEVLSVPLSELRPYYRNPRRGNVDAIAESLSVRGQYKPIVVNAGTLTGRPMEILAGNHTFAAARQLGWDSLQAVTVDVDDEGAAQIVLADNRIADLGGYNDVDLAEVLELAGDLSGTGYEDADLAALLRDLNEPVGLTDPDDAPDVPEVPLSRLGDVFELGPHRLVVGSCEDASAVYEALGGLADCVWTDPPYGVSYVGGTGLSIMNDGLKEATSTTASAFSTIIAVTRPGAPVYVAHADIVRVPFQLALEEAGLIFRQTLLWVKDSLVMSRADYHYRSEPILHAVVPEDLPDEEEFEPIAYGFTPGGSGRLGRGGPRWFGDNKSSTVFQVPRPKRNAVHPTMKPVELIEAMLKNSCPPGGKVLDLFAGSGSTMIAAHRLGLQAVLVELDPKYADVICRRWQEHTGIVPLRDGVPVDFVGGA